MSVSIIQSTWGMHSCERFHCTD